MSISIQFTWVSGGNKTENGFQKVVQLYSNTLENISNALFVRFKCDFARKISPFMLHQTHVSNLVNSPSNELYICVETGSLVLYFLRWIPMEKRREFIYNGRVYIRFRTAFILTTRQKQRI